MPEDVKQLEAVTPVQCQPQFRSSNKGVSLASIKRAVVADSSRFSVASRARLSPSSDTRKNAVRAVVFSLQNMG